MLTAIFPQMARLSNIINSNMEGECAFCGRWTTLTEEDALPSWLMRYLWPPEKHIPVAKTWGTAQQLSKNWKYGYDLRLKTMTLCETCNTGWLGPFEELSKSKLRAWISGIKVTVPHGERKLLAFWAVKTAMTVDLANPSGRNIPQGQLHELQRNRDYPPEGAHVWAALRRKKIRGIEHRSRAFQFEHVKRDEILPRAKLYAGYDVRFLIGHLELRVIALDGSGAEPLQVYPSEVVPLVRSGSPFYRLWPMPEVPVLVE